jgi:glycosyltransferase involved in cell wall biosynthesis
MGYLPDDEVIKLYANTLAVFYAPYDEDYGFATVEAFLSSKPIITTTDSGGVLEFVRDGENGLVSSTGHKEIADKINWLFAHKKQCREFGLNGHETVKGITWDRVIGRLVD